MSTARKPMAIRAADPDDIAASVRETPARLVDIQ
jgi:hypothetical protein